MVEGCILKKIREGEGGEQQVCGGGGKKEGGGGGGGGRYDLSDIFVVGCYEIQYGGATLLILN